MPCSLLSGLPYPSITNIALRLQFNTSDVPHKSNGNPFSGHTCGPTCCRMYRVLTFRVGPAAQFSRNEAMPSERCVYQYTQSEHLLCGVPPSRVKTEVESTKHEDVVLSCASGRFPGATAQPALRRFVAGVNLRVSLKSQRVLLDLRIRPSVEARSFALSLTEPAPKGKH